MKFQQFFLLAGIGLILPPIAGCEFTNDRTSSLHDSTEPGSCATDDMDFNSEEGGCLDFTSGLVWSRRADSLLSHAAAASYCDGLVEAGKTDWRLPDGRELKKLGRADGARLHLRFSVSDFFWSSSSNQQGGMGILPAGDPEGHYFPLSDQLAVMCTRVPLDVDGDHVPNSSDECSGTSRGDPVETIGERKGCSEGDEPFAIRGDFPDHRALCESCDERLCRRTPGCGWSHRVGCLHIWARECSYFQDPIFCKTTPGCLWENNRCIAIE